MKGFPLAGNLARLNILTRCISAGERGWRLAAVPPSASRARGRRAGCRSPSGWEWICSALGGLGRRDRLRIRLPSALRGFGVGFRPVPALQPQLTAALLRQMVGPRSGGVQINYSRNNCLQAEHCLRGNPHLKPTGSLLRQSMGHRAAKQGCARGAASPSKGPAGRLKKRRGWRRGRNEGITWC